MKLHVGVGSFRGSVSRFAFDLLELPVSPTLPRPKTLAEYRRERPDLEITLRLHPDVLTRSGPEHPDVARALAAAQAASSRFIIAPSGPTFSPTAGNRARLAALAGTIRAGGAELGWEPRGLFAAEEAQAWAEEAGAFVVTDLTRESGMGGPLIYTRLLPLGLGARVGLSSLETLVERLEGCEEAFVVVGGEGAKGARQRLRERFGLETGA
jgi:hypothetical protein